MCLLLAFTNLNLPSITFLTLLTVAQQTNKEQIGKLGRAINLWSVNEGDEV